MSAITDSLEETTVVPPLQEKPTWHTWYDALKNTLPIYVAIHLACLVISALAILFTVPDFYWQSPPLFTLWHEWLRWDADHYIFIAAHGYDSTMRTAFFPLYPFLIRGGMIFTHDALTAGLLVSSLADLVMLVVLYQLVKEDFGEERAQRTILYISIFPTAFFFLAIYNESLFVCLSVLFFYFLRHKKWWWAGIFGGLACLTRSAGILLLLPFCYEYISQHQFNLKKLRFDLISILLIPAGTGIYALYCYRRFHDLLAFAHAQKEWNRALHLPWQGIAQSMQAIAASNGFLSFQSLRNLTDLMPDLFLLLLVILGFVGPWRFPRKLWAYGIYALALYLILHLFPNGGTGLYPLESISRFMLEIFPGFIILAAIGKRSKTLNMTYLMIAGAIFFFLLTQFLTNHWVL